MGGKHQMLRFSVKKIALDHSKLKEIQLQTQSRVGKSSCQDGILKTRVIPNFTIYID